MAKNYWKRLLIIPAIALGVLGLMLLVKSKKGPEQLPPTEIARPVRIIRAAPVDLVPRAVGYGEVLPAQEWDAVAEVSGTVVRIHPDLDKGAILSKGELLLSIETTDYDLARTRAESQVRTARANLRELEQRETDLRESLRVEEQALKLAAAELERKRELLRQGLIARSEVDSEEKSYLAQKNAVQNYRTSLNAIPAERETLQAQLASGLSTLEGARRDVARTSIYAPFDCRITEVNVEKDQFAAVGQTLLRAYATSASEVLAHFPLSGFRAVIADETRSDSIQSFTMTALREYLDLSAVVRLRMDDRVVEWKARFSRPAEELDPDTRSIGVYVVVDESYRQAQPGVRPPLVKNMYTEVELRGPARPDRIVLPRSALHDGRVYLVDADNRLVVQPVEIDYRQGSLAAVAAGVAPGDRVVVSDLMPAVESMLLDPIEDTELTDDLFAEAAGLTPAR